MFETFEGPAVLVCWWSEVWPPEYGRMDRIASARADILAFTVLLYSAKRETIKAADQTL